MLQPPGRQARVPPMPRTARGWQARASRRPRSRGQSRRPRRRPRRPSRRCKPWRLAKQTRSLWRGARAWTPSSTRRHVQAALQAQTPRPLQPAARASRPRAGTRPDGRRARRRGAPLLRRPPWRQRQRPRPAPRPHRTATPERSAPTPTPAAAAGPAGAAAPAAAAATGQGARLFGHPRLCKHQSQRRPRRADQLRAGAPPPPPPPPPLPPTPRPRTANTAAATTAAAGSGLKAAQCLASTLLGAGRAQRPGRGSAGLRQRERPGARRCLPPAFGGGGWGRRGRPLLLRLRGAPWARRRREGPRARFGGGGLALALHRVRRGGRLDVLARVSRRQRARASEAPASRRG